MKTIMIVMPELYYGGAEKQFRFLAAGLDKRTYNVIVVDEHAYGSEIIKAPKSYLDNNKEILYIELKKRKCNRILKYLLINLDMMRVIRKHTPDLLFSSSLKLAFLCKVLNIPFVYSERNSAKGNKYYLEKKQALKISSIVTCNSRGASKELMRHGIDSIFVINGIEECNLIKICLSSRLIFVPARISSEKNQEIVIEAMPYLPKDVKALFAGMISDKDYLNRIRNRIEELGLEDRVEIIGYTDNVKELYNKSAVVVLPSITEGASNVILECYMYGRLCVISDISENRDVSSDIQRFFDPNSARILAERILDVFDLKPYEYEDECEYNHKFVIDNYGMPRMVEEYKQIFDEVISE